MGRCVVQMTTTELQVASAMAEVKWPESDDEVVEFGPRVMLALREKDYCIVEMPITDQERTRAMEEADSRNLRYMRVKKELELAYLGREANCKVCWMQGVADQKEQLEGVLDSCDMYFSSFCELVDPLTLPALGFVAESRTNCMVRAPFADAAEAQSMKVLSIDGDDIDDGMVESHISFCRRRALAMMLVVESSGGELTFIPQDAEASPIPLKVAKGQLIVFRHDRLSYVYKAADSYDLVLQAWLLAMPPPVQLRAVHQDGAAMDQSLGLLKGPGTPGERTNLVNVFSLTPGLPAEAHDDVDRFWALLSVGTDGYTRAPLARFDIDPYYAPAETWTFGQTYACHAGFVFEDIYTMDAEFFGIEEAEAYITNPATRKCLEHGYQCLYAGGLRREDLRNRNIGLWVGHSGDDWSGSPLYTMPNLVRGAGDEYRNGYTHREWHIMFCRIPMVFGMRGPVTIIDTACSSALSAYNMAHTSLRNLEDDQEKVGVSNSLSEALLMGANMIPGPGNFVSLCGPHLLSPTGRCFTFDHSADGFARGEGTGGLYLKATKGYGTGALACMIGACSNQDGRSASMTAPNGPSQQECIRGSMKEAGLSANEVTCAELHGTGTALGDPIEVGALKGVMKDRKVPLAETSAKAHIGHLEASAGLAGVFKCIVMCHATCGTPSPHLCELNPHLDVAGYPTIFCTELTEYGGNSGYSGVSSFGWGGANARADIWAACQRGPHKLRPVSENAHLQSSDYLECTCPIDDGPMHYLDCQVLPTSASDRIECGGIKSGSIRDEFDTYDCNNNDYEGAWILEDDREAFKEEVLDAPVCIVGTWSRFAEMHTMEADEDEVGIHTFRVRLGETRYERFRLYVEGDVEQSIYPVATNGSMRTRVVGPDKFGEGKWWILDGRDEQVPVGTAYQITFRWTATRKEVSWEPTTFDVPAGISVKPSYSVVGSFTSGGYHTMHRSEADPNTYEVKVKISVAGKEFFQFLRNQDPKQQIYPSENRPTSQDVPVRGPDEFGREKMWVVTGIGGDLVTIRLRVEDAHITVSVEKGAISQMWESKEGPERHDYYIRGSFLPNEYVRMDPVAGKPGVYRSEGRVRTIGGEAFNILMDGDESLVFHPEVSRSLPGKAILMGPDAKSLDSYWEVPGLCLGAVFEILLDLTAVNKRQRLTVNWLSDAVDLESMKATVRQTIVNQQVQAAIAF